LDHRQAVKKCGMDWVYMKNEDKEKYLKMEEEDLKRYESQMKQLEEKGYFKYDDG